MVPAGSLEINNQPWKDYKTTIGNKLNITVTIRNDGTVPLRAVNVRFFDNDVLFAERNSSTIASLGTARFQVQWEALTLGPHIITAEADPANMLGEVNENNNNGTCNIVVKKAPTGDVLKGEAGGWLYTLLVIVVICGAAGGAYVLYQRRPKYDKELYESIYGKKGEAGREDGSLTADRAEVEKRAIEKADEMPAATYGLETPTGLTEEDFAQQPGGSPAAPAYASGASMDMGQSVAPPEAPEGPPPEPSTPQEPSKAVPKKKKISIRPSN